jgi:hypothetical protein
MATAVQQRRGTATEHDDGAGFTGLEGEITVDTTNDTIRVHDNSTKGGHRLAKYSELSTVASPISPTDAGTDTTMFPLLSGDATGTLSAKTDADGLTYNASSKTLTTTNIVATSISGTASNATVASSANTIVTYQTGTGDNFLLMVDADANAAQNARVRGEVKWDVGTSNLTIDGTVTADSFILEDGSGNKTTLAENASGDITLTLPSATGTVALTSDIGFVAPTTVVGSAAVNDMTSNISKKYVHTGSDVTLKFPNVTASSNLGDTWVVVNAGTDTLTFDRVTSGTSQFKQLNGSTVASLANTITLSKGGVAELTVTADNEIIIFGSGVI